MSNDADSEMEQFARFLQNVLDSLKDHQITPDEGGFIIAEYK